MLRSLCDILPYCKAMLEVGLPLLLLFPSLLPFFLCGLFISHGAGVRSGSARPQDELLSVLSLDSVCMGRRWVQALSALARSPPGPIKKFCTP